jgi:threonine dehydratase
LADDAVRSFRSKTLQTVQNPPTIADGTRTASLGKLSFPLVLEYVDDMNTVSEEAIKEAVRWLFSRMKLVVEPSGALGVAALLSGAVRLRGRVGVILSGGNVDAAVMAGILQDHLTPP